MRPRALLPAALPGIAALAGFGLSLPEHLGFREFVTGDLGASLDSTRLAAQAQPGVRFAFPYGPLTLAVQQCLASPRGFAVLALLCALALAAAAGVAIRQLRLGWCESLLLSLAGFGLGALAWAPVYGLEAALLAWAVVLFALRRPSACLAICVAAAMVKPSMAVLLGVGFLLVAREWRVWRAAGVTALVLGGALAAHFRARAFMALLSPAAGMRNYHALHYSFFARADNPLLVPGADWKYFLGTATLPWLIATATLGVLLARPAARRLAWGPARLGRGPRELDRYRWWAAAACFLGTLVFIVAFYAHPLSFYYYVSLPLIGLAILPNRSPRALAAVAVLSALGMTTMVRVDVRAWRDRRPAAVTAGLWATPAERAEWETLAPRRPLVLGLGSAEALFPELGAPWHGYMVEGQATVAVLAEMQSRAARHDCIAIARGWWPQDAPVAVTAARRRLPHMVGPLFDSYGCAAAAAREVN